MIETTLTSVEKQGFRTHTFCKNQLIPSRPELIYEVISGEVKIISPSINSTSLISLRGPKDFFKVPKECEALPFEHNAIVAWHYTQHLEDLRQLHPYKIGLRKQIESQQKLNLALSQLKSMDKIQGLLSFLYETYPKLTISGRIPGNLTHQEIADTVGLTRVTVTRQIQLLRSKGVINTIDGYNYFIEKNFEIENLHFEKFKEVMKKLKLEITFFDNLELQLDAHQKLTSILSNPNQKDKIFLFLQFLNKLMIKDNNTHEISVNLLQKDIQFITGCSKTHFSKSVKKLKQEGLLKT